MKKIFALLAVPVLAGCLSSSSMPPAVRWMLAYRGTLTSAAVPKFGATRLSQVIVSPPFNSLGLAVLRADGTLAVDPYNEFAAQPSQLLKGLVFEALSSSGLFSTVVGPASAASAPNSVEVVVSRLALDCRKDDRRRAVATVLVRVLNKREIASVTTGEGAVDAADGDFGKAFSTAVSLAVESALKQIP